MKKKIKKLYDRPETVYQQLIETNTLCAVSILVVTSEDVLISNPFEGEIEESF